MLRILFSIFVFYPALMMSQPKLDSLYGLLRVQNNANMIHLYKDGFFTIGFGTDIAPFNSYGTLFTSYDFDGGVRFSTYTLDSNKTRAYRDINIVVKDSFVYTIHNGSLPDELIKININNGNIVFRKEYYNMAGGTITGAFPGSIHMIDSNTLLINVTGYAQGNQWVTQLCRYSIPYDTFDYFFNSYSSYNQSIKDLVQTSTGFILTGSV